jgi:enoyl-CoA hydratase
MSEDLIIKQTGDVLEITLNQPERGNAMSDPMIVELSEIIEREHEKVRLFVLRGAGEDFCIGRSSMGRARPNSPEAYDVRGMSDHVFHCYGLLRRSVAPVLAVVQGRAAGFGYALAAAADITIASDKARFSIPEFDHNIMPTMVMSSMIDRVPLKALMYNVWTCQEMTPEHALMIGSISDIVPHAELETRVTAFIDRLAGKPKPGVLAVKEYGVNAQAIDMSKAVHFARSLHAMVNSSSQMKRGQHS